MLKNWTMVDFVIFNWWGSLLFVPAPMVGVYAALTFFICFLFSK